MRRTRNGLSLLFFTLAQLVGLVLWIAYAATWTRWQGGFGFLIGVFTAPGLVIFPFVFWMVENSFPVNYFLLWLVGLALMVLAGLTAGDA